MNIEFTTMSHYANTLEIDVFVPAKISSVMSCFTHTCRHSVCGGLQLTSWSSSGSIIGGSSPLGERAGDEESLFSHSVRPGVLSPVSRKERFSSLMLVWCLTISSGGVVSYSSRSTMIQGDEARSGAEGTTAMLYVRNGSLQIQWITKKNAEKHKMQFWKGLTSTNSDLNQLHYKLHSLSLLFNSNTNSNIIANVHSHGSWN